MLSIFLLIFTLVIFYNEIIRRGNDSHLICYYLGGMAGYLVGDIYTQFFM